MIERVIYVGGVGRSGSTFLDALLMEGPDVFSGGELSNLFEWAATGRECTCGRSLTACPIWSDVLQQVSAATATSDWTTMAEISVAGDSTTTPSDAYEHIWSQVYAAMSGIVRVPVIADSSKSTPESQHRPSRYADLGVRVDIIHLVRDPRYVVASIASGSNRAMEGHVQTTWRPLISMRAGLGWLRADIACVREARRLGVRRLVATYEDVASDPQGAAQRLRHLLELKAPAGTADAWIEDHSIAGNRARRSGRANHDFVPNSSRLTVAARVFGGLLWPIYALHRRRSSRLFTAV